MTTPPILLTLELDKGSAKDKIILSNVPSWEQGQVALNYPMYDLTFDQSLQFVVKAKTSSKILLALANSPKEFLRRTATREVAVDFYSMPDQLLFEWKLLKNNVKDKIVGKTFKLMQSNVPMVEVNCQHLVAF